MTLRKKTFIIIGITLVGVLTFLCLISHTFFLKSFTKLDEKNHQKNVELVMSALSNDLSSLNSVVGNIAGQNDTITYILHNNSDYIQNHFTSSTFVENRLNLVMFVNESGNIIFKKYFDLSDYQETPMPRALQDQLANNTLLLQQHTELEGNIKGLITLPGGPMLVASRSIVTQANSTYIGKIIVGRYLDSIELEYLSKSINTSVTLEPFNSSKLAQSFLNKSSGITQDNIIIKPINREKTVGYTVLTDISGTPAYILKAEMSRTIFLNGLYNLTIFLLFTAFGWLIFGLIFNLLLENVLFSRLYLMGTCVNNMKTDLSVRVPVKGKDEIAQLAVKINEMLTEFQRFHTELHQSEERYRNLAVTLDAAQQELQNIIDFLPDATFVVDQNRRVIAWNRAIEEMTGVKKEEIIGKGDGIYSTPFYGKPGVSLIDYIFTDSSELIYPADYLEKNGSTLIAETHVPALFNGKGSYLWVKASPLYDRNGQIVGAIESIRDISTRLHAEKQLRFLKNHDSVTGLYNRNYFEQEITRLAQAKIAPMTILACGMDGLKLVDDTLGHEAGDALLRATAQILQDVLAGKAILARIGGDEFAAFLPGFDRKMAEEIYRKISERIEQYNTSNPEIPLSMSIGFAASNDPNANLYGLLKEADNNMYHEKLHYSQNTQSATVQMLMRALEAKDFAKEGHVDRLQSIVVSVGAALGMSERRINSLRRLAVFHDIGKVGVPDRILQKQGPLSPAEITEMQRHCEIGFRIAQSTPVLVPIADWILKHHEWWNGKGYPLGLQGKEIPLECRLLAIADAWDALTSDRPYRKAMTYEKAAAELTKRSGTQFDPELVETFLQVLERESGQIKIQVINNN